MIKIIDDYSELTEEQVEWLLNQRLKAQMIDYVKGKVGADFEEQVSNVCTKETNFATNDEMVRLIVDLLEKQDD